MRCVTRTIPITPGDNINGDTSAGGATANCDTAIAADAEAAAAGGGGMGIDKSAFKSGNAMDDSATAAAARAGVSV